MFQSVKMKISITTAAVVFLGFASAAPADLEVRGTPSNAPVTVGNPFAMHRLELSWCT